MAAQIKKKTKEAKPKVGAAVLKKKPALKAPEKKAPEKKKKSVAPKKAKDLPASLLAEVLNILDDRQGEDILAFDLRGHSALADYAVIATGRSSRQLVAMAEYLCQAFAKMGLKKVRIEGLPQADWVLVDAGDILIHLFRPDVRDYYHIEDIFSAFSPVKKK